MSMAYWPTGFQPSGCCGTPMWRFALGDGGPDRFVCLGCSWECSPRAQRLRARLY